MGVHHLSHANLYFGCELPTLHLCSLKSNCEITLEEAVGWLLVLLHSQPLRGRGMMGLLWPSELDVGCTPLSYRWAWHPSNKNHWQIAEKWYLGHKSIHSGTQKQVGNNVAYVCWVGLWHQQTGCFGKCCLGNLSYWLSWKREVRQAGYTFQSMQMSQKSPQWNCFALGNMQIPRVLSPIYMVRVPMKSANIQQPGEASITLVGKCKQVL